MFVKPSSAFVGKPSVVASSSGSAKNARYARLLPSTRKSSESRAGASSRSSSRPVSVFGDIASESNVAAARRLTRLRLAVRIRSTGVDVQRGSPPPLRARGLGGWRLVPRDPTVRESVALRHALVLAARRTVRLRSGPSADVAAVARRAALPARGRGARGARRGAARARRSSSSRRRCRFPARRTTRASSRSAPSSTSSSGSGSRPATRRFSSRRGWRGGSSQRELETLVTPELARRFHGRVVVHDVEDPELVASGRLVAAAAAREPRARRDRSRGRRERRGVGAARRAGGAARRGRRRCAARRPARTRCSRRRRRRAGISRSRSSARSRGACRCSACRSCSTIRRRRARCAAIRTTRTRSSGSRGSPLRYVYGALPEMLRRDVLRSLRDRAHGRRRVRRAAVGRACRGAAARGASCARASSTSRSTRS